MNYEPINKPLTSEYEQITAPNLSFTTSVRAAISLPEGSNVSTHTRSTFWHQAFIYPRLLPFSNIGSIITTGLSVKASISPNATKSLTAFTFCTNAFLAFSNFIPKYHFPCTRGKGHTISHGHSGHLGHNCEYTL